MATYQEWQADLNRQRADAQRQLSEAQAYVNANSNLPTSYRNDMERNASHSQLMRLNNANSRLAAARNRLESINSNAEFPGDAGAGSGAGSVDSRVAENRRQAYDLARGGVNRLVNDPTDALIRQRLQEATQSGAGPYDATTRNAMFTNAMESSGADAQAQSIVESAARRGMRPDDPSVQAALRRAQDQQAQGAQRARLGIDLEANRANYGAQQSALNRLGDYNQSRQGQIQSAEDRLREMLWNEGFNRSESGPQVATPDWGASAPAPASQQQRSAGIPPPPFVPRRSVGLQPVTVPRRGGGLTPPNGIVGRPVGRVQVGTVTPGVGPTTQTNVSPAMWTARGSAGTRTGFNQAQQPRRAVLAGPQMRQPTAPISRQDFIPWRQPVAQPRQAVNPPARQFGNVRRTYE